MLSSLHVLRPKGYFRRVQGDSRTLLQTRSFLTTRALHEDSKTVHTKTPRLSVIDLRRKILAEKIGIPESLLPPKRPGKALSFFLADFTKLHRLTGFRASERTKILSEGWKDMSDAEKQVYKDKAKAAYAEYEQKAKEWANSVHPDLIKKIEKHMLDEKGRKIVAVHMKRSDNLQSPLPFYPQFTKDFMKQYAKEHGAIVGTKGAREMMKEVSAAWKALPEAEKDAYRTRYANAKEEYTVQLEKLDLKGKKRIGVPGSAYALFLSDFFKTYGGHGITTEGARQAGAAWKALSEAEKEVYMERYKKKREEYLLRREQTKAEAEA